MAKIVTDLAATRAIMFFFHLPSSVRWKGRGKGWGVEVANNELAMKDVDV